MVLVGSNPVMTFVDGWVPVASLVGVLSQELTVAIAEDVLVPTRRALRSTREVRSSVGLVVTGASGASAGCGAEMLQGRVLVQLPNLKVERSIEMLLCSESFDPSLRLISHRGSSRLSCRSCGVGPGCGCVGPFGVVRGVWGCR